MSYALTVLESLMLPAVPWKTMESVNEPCLRIASVTEQPTMLTSVAICDLTTNQLVQFPEQVAVTSYVGCSRTQTQSGPSSIAEQELLDELLPKELSLESEMLLESELPLDAELRLDDDRLEGRSGCLVMVRSSASNRYATRERL